MGTHNQIRFLAFMCMGVLSVSLARGQGNSNGRLIGRVIDQTGAAVPNAAVKTLNTATNVEASTKSNMEGNFEILDLIPGEYVLSAELQGFKRYERKFDIRIGDVLSMPISMELGAQTESITVQAETQLLDSASSSVGLVTDSQRIANLPVPAASPIYLLSLAPNMAALTPPGANWTPDAQNLTSTFIADGTPQNSTEFLVDGAPGTYQGGGLLGIIPPPEMIAEFRTVTTYDASLGRGEGAQVIVALKSGTNALHGDIAYSYKGRPLTTHPFFVNQAIYDLSTGPVTSSKISQLWPGINYNRFRGGVGGPVIIPKAYNGRNRTFWQFGWDLMRVPVQNPGYYTVPTPAERTGDFSALLALGSQYQIYNPFSATLLANGRVSRTPFPNNIIPANLINSTSEKIMSYYELPNATATVSGLNNYIASQNGSTVPKEYLGRLDQTIAPNHRMSFTYMELILHNHERPYFQNISTGRQFFGFWYTGGLEDVVTLRPDTVLETHLSYFRLRYYDPPNSSGFNLSTLGLPQSLIQTMDPTQTLFPQVSIDNAQYLTLGNETNQYSGNTYYTASSTISHVRGNHSFRAGVAIKYYMVTGINYGTTYSPSYVFNSSFTQGPLDNSPGAPIGQGLASFLLGLPTGGSTTRPDSIVESSKNYGWFILDDWKVSRKLTLNIGLRHEIEVSPIERYNRVTRGFDFSDPSPVQALAQANYAANPIPQIPANAFHVVGGLLFAGVGGVPREAYEFAPHHFMPRIGLAFQMTPKTVIRAGYGIYYDSLGADRITLLQQGFTGTTPLVPSVDNGLTFQATINNPFPNGLVAASKSSLGLGTFLGNTVNFIDPTRDADYSQRWNINVQRELPGHMMVEVGYTGNRATHLPMNQDFDAIPTQYLSTSPFRDTATINLLTSTVPNPFYGIPAFAGTSLANAIIARSQLLLPYPEFTDVTATTDRGFAWYHAGSARLDKRFSGGFTIGAAYTFSKNMEATQQLNPEDLFPSHVISANDRPQRIALSGIYELPVGRGRHFLSSASGLVNRILGGWVVTSIYQGQSGPALSFGDVAFYGNINNIALPSSQHSINEWFNVNAGFATSASQQLADNYRTFPLRLSGVRAAGINVLDVSLQKSFRIRERARFELRADSKNIANHAQWAAPNTTPTSPLFGEVTATQGNEQRSVTVTGRITW